MRGVAGVSWNIFVLSFHAGELWPIQNISIVVNKAVKKSVQKSFCRHSDSFDYLTKFVNSIIFDWQN